MERVLLYNPLSESYTMPLGLLAVGSSLPASSYRVEIHDGRLDRASFFRELERGDVLAVGLSVLTGKPIEDALAVSRQVKEVRPELPVVWGGWHPSILPEQCLRLPFVDYVVAGQGETSFFDLLERLRRGESAEGCRGVGYKVEGRVVLNPPRPFQDVNGFPPLRYDFIDVPAYFALKGKRQLDYYSSQGCPYTCTFCADPFVFNHHWAGLAAERVARELVALKRRYGAEDVFFNDDLFFVNQKRLEAIVDAFLAEGSPFTWVAAGRADLLKRYPDALMEKIRRSGCRRISIGAESGSQQMLDAMRKKLAVEDIYLAARRCNDYGIQLAFSFMTGFPQEDPRVLEDTVELIQRIKRVNGRFETPIFFYYAYPGTELTEKLSGMGVELPRDIEGWIDFDLYRANVPWLGKNYKKRVERMNFYLRWAYRRPESWWNGAAWALAAASRLRVATGFYELALEMRLIEALKRREEPRPASTVQNQIAFKLKNVCG
jgi:radical SAM superfamily enzyme YgiQ (UPF0313 family)